MYGRKVYGESRIDPCPFCSKQSIIKNPQGIPVCMDHKAKTLDNMRCSCGSHLLIQEGKFGVFFNCLSCGNLNLRKVLDINSHIINPEKNKIPKNDMYQKKQKDDSFLIRSDDARFFD